jgi:hypothetical protein
MKSATLDNAVQIRVPQFIKAGDLIRLNVGSLKSIELAKGARK